MDCIPRLLQSKIQPIQTHCYACGEHGFVEHTNKPIQITEKEDDSWKHEYRGGYYTLHDRKLRAETLERYKVKCEKDEKGRVIIADVFPKHLSDLNEAFSKLGLEEKLQLLSLLKKLNGV